MKSPDPARRRINDHGAPQGAHLSWLPNVHDAAVWDALPLVERIAGTEIGRLMLGWPEDASIEVRLCSKCARTVTARRGT